MTIEKASEARRNFYVGEHGTFSIASAEASPLHGELSQPPECRRSIVEPSVCRGANAVFESNRNRVARSARSWGGDDHGPRADVI